MGFLIVIIILILIFNSIFRNRSTSSRPKDSIARNSFRSGQKHSNSGTPRKDFIGSGQSSRRPTRFKQLVKGGYYHQPTLMMVTQGIITGSKIVDVVLKHDPSNIFDSNAIQVLYKGQLLGFIPKEETRKFVIASASYSASAQSMQCEAFMSWFTKSNEIDADIYLDTSKLSL